MVKKSSCQVVLNGVKLDASYHYENSSNTHDCYIQLESLVDDKGEQDLMPLINVDFYYDTIIEQIKKAEKIV